MLFISTGIFDDKLRPQIVSVGTTANAALRDFRLMKNIIFNQTERFVGETLVTMPVKYFAPKVTVKLGIIDFSYLR
jgi:hypothetical protein